MAAAAQAGVTRAASSMAGALGAIAGIGWLDVVTGPDVGAAGIAAAIAWFVADTVTPPRRR